MITEKDMNILREILTRATRSELDKIDDEVQKEIRLSNTAIKEGMEEEE